MMQIDDDGVVYKGYDVKQMVRKVSAATADHRPDLSKDAISRVTYLHKALRVAKAGTKK